MIPVPVNLSEAEILVEIAVPLKEWVVVFLYGAPVMVEIGGIPVPVLARMVRGRRSTVRMVRIRFCIFADVW